MRGADDADEPDTVAEGRVDDLDSDSSRFNPLTTLPLADDGNARLDLHNLHRRSQPTRTNRLSFATPWNI